MQTRTFVKLAFWCGIGVVGLNGSSIAYTTQWGYAGKEGPAQWAKLSPTYAACGAVGTQSPIHIEPLFTQQEKPLKIAYQAVDFTAKHAPDDVYFYSNNPAADSITVDNQTYQLQEIHFHVPAEHQLGKQHYPMEVHLVHVDTQGNMLAIGVLMETGASSPFLAEELKAMTSHKSHLKLNPASLLPSKHAFYMYDGSLTTPPCSPVKWVVMKAPVTVSQEELNEFKQKITSMNARPLQARGNREIIEVLE